MKRQALPPHRPQAGIKFGFVHHYTGMGVAVVEVTGAVGMGREGIAGDGGGG